MHRGAFVNALDAAAVRDHYELFGLVYGFAAERAMARGDTGTLVTTLAELAGAVGATDDPDEVARLTIAFHGAIVDAARSPRISVLLRSMSGMLPGNFFALVPGAIEIERKGLAAIVRAARRGDGARMASEYRRMLARMGERVVVLLTERGLFDTEPESPYT
jgi:DNA-binding GntR family transcriptional regulator